MTIAFALQGVTKRFDDNTALRSVTLEIETNRIVGLIGKNGSGKTTLLRHVTGMYLPTEGRCLTLGAPTPELGPGELSRIGVVHQDDKFLYWMRVEQQIRYVASFYDRWDRDLEHRLLEALELDPTVKVSKLTPAVCRSWRSSSRSVTTPRCCCSTSRLAILIRSRARRCS
jgi:ABC-2 type transport system ATP-binding protein